MINSVANAIGTITNAASAACSVAAEVESGGGKALEVTVFASSAAGVAFAGALAAVVKEREKRQHELRYVTPRDVGKIRFYKKALVRREDME